MTSLSNLFNSLRPCQCQVRGREQILHLIDLIWIQEEPLDLGGKQVEIHGIGFDLKLFSYGFGSFISVFKF